MTASRRPSSSGLWLVLLAALQGTLVCDGARTTVDLVKEETAGSQVAPPVGTCAEKFAKKPPSPCQVFVRFFGKLAFTLDMEEDTTLGDLKQKLERWIEDQARKAGSSAEQGRARTFVEQDVNFIHRVDGQRKKLGGGAGQDADTLLSLGVTAAETYIDAEKGVQGGLAYGHVVSVPGPESLLWPDRDFIVQILYQNPIERIQELCTGLIRGNKVLTAGHCFYGKPHKYLKKYMQFIAADGSVHELRSVAIHPDFKGGDGVEYAAAPDMAVATLEGYGYAPKAQVKLMENRITTPMAVSLAGFGMTEKGYEGGFRYRPLVEGQFVTGDGGCRVHSYTGYVSPVCGCAHSGQASATSSCVGDSGAPWWWKDGLGTFWVFAVHFGADECRGWENLRATSDFVWLSETRDFWMKHFPVY